MKTIKGIDFVNAKGERIRNYSMVKDGIAYATMDLADSTITRLHISPRYTKAGNIWANRTYKNFIRETMPEHRINPTAAIKTLEPGSKSVDAYGTRYVGRGQLPRAIAIGRRFHWLAFKEPGHTGISKIGIHSGYGYIEFNGSHGKHWWMSTGKRTRQIAPPVKLITYIGEQIRDADYPRHNPRYEVKGSYQARGMKSQHFHSGLLTVDAPNKRLAERKARASGHYVFGHRFRPFRVREI